MPKITTGTNANARKMGKITTGIMSYARKAPQITTDKYVNTGVNVFKG